MRGSESIQAAFAPRHVLPTEWKPFAVYLDTVTFRYHNDTGAMHNIIIEPQQGVRLLGQNILPTAVPVRHQQWWDAANPRWGMLRDKGHMCWQDDYVLLAPTSLSNVPQLLEFTVRGTHPDRLFSARITLVDEKGAHLCTATLLDTISLGLDDQSFRFDLSHVAFQYWNDTGRDHCIKIDPGPGVQLLGENILPSAVLVGHSWGAPSEGNPRWRWLRTDGTFAWQGRYEMIRSEIDRNDPVMSLPVELPDYWAAEAENVPSRRLPESPEVIQAVQKLLDNTWRSTVTRDRAEDQEGARATVPRMEVVQVVRNENPSLWLPYWRERERIRRRCEGKALSNETVKTDEDSSLILHHFSLMKEVREFYLFHGTRPSAANTICESDFNVDLAGSRMGTLYVRGIYFAEASSKADEYADDDKDLGETSDHSADSTDFEPHYIQPVRVTIDIIYDSLNMKFLTIS